MRTEKDNWFLYHLSNYILTFTNTFNEGLTNIVMIIPGLFASLTLIILSPLYYYTNIGFSQALMIGNAGLIHLPIKLLIGISQILFAPIAYPVFVYLQKNNKAKKKKKDKPKGNGPMIPIINWNPNVA
jgi:hypothetical protein